jgi:hypothetical protein
VKWGPPAHVAAALAAGFKPKFANKPTQPDLTFEQLMQQLAPEGWG